MSMQHERVLELCNELRLGGVAAQYTALAQKAAEKHTSFSDFVEELLSAERDSRRARAREMFARIACFPAVKTLDQYDFNFTPGAPRKQIMELASLAFVERSENVVFLGPSGVGKTHLAIARLSRHPEGLQDSLLKRSRSGSDAGSRPAPGPLSRCHASRGQRLQAADPRRYRLSAEGPRAGQSVLPTGHARLRARLDDPHF